MFIYASKCLSSIKRINKNPYTFVIQNTANSKKKRKWFLSEVDYRKTRVMTIKTNYKQEKIFN